MVELHIGTNVGYNYCTDDFVDEQIVELLLPIDHSKIPADLTIDTVIDCVYVPTYPDCDDCCVPHAMLYVENFWFHFERGKYAKI